MKKLLLAVMAIICMNGQAQASWAPAAKVGFGAFFGSVPLMSTIGYYGNKLSSIGLDTNQSIQAGTLAGNGVIQEIGKATAELNKFTPILESKVFQDKGGVKDFMSNVLIQVCTTIALQLLLHAAMHTMQTIATSLITQENNPELNNGTPVQAQGLTPEEIARRRRVFSA